MYVFRKAVAAGADMLVLDVHATAGGELIVMRDWTVDRTTDGTGYVSDLTLAQVRRLDAAYHRTRLRGMRRTATASRRAASSDATSACRRSPRAAGASRGRRSTSRSRAAITTRRSSCATPSCWPPCSTARAARPDRRLGQPTRRRPLPRARHRGPGSAVDLQEPLLRLLQRPPPPRRSMSARAATRRDGGSMTGCSTCASTGSSPPPPWRWSAACGRVTRGRSTRARCAPRGRPWRARPWPSGSSGAGSAPRPTRAGSPSAREGGSSAARTSRWARGPRRCATRRAHAIRPPGGGRGRPRGGVYCRFARAAREGVRRSPACASEHVTPQLSGRSWHPTSRQAELAPSSRVRAGGPKAAECGRRRESPSGDGVARSLPREPVSSPRRQKREKEGSTKRGLTSHPSWIRIRSPNAISPLPRCGSGRCTARTGAGSASAMRAATPRARRARPWPPARPSSPPRS